MFVTSLLSLAVLLPFAASKTIDVQVGKGGLVFSPPAVSAQPGDQVVFHFVAKNHSVTQSSFQAPCSRKEGGFDSGFHPVPPNSTVAPPTFAVTVNDTDPIWVFCAQAEDTPASHCGAGMIFAINCGDDGAPNSLSNFKAEALAIGASLSAAALPAATAAYGGLTIPAAPEPTLVTATISLNPTSVWQTVYSSYPGSPAATPVSAGGAVHVVVVGGNDGLIFSPSHIQAAPRDTVVFEFHQKNHSVVQSSFADPCRKLNNNGATGFISDFFPVAADQTSGFPTFNITVNDTNPIWAYCRQQTPSSHCGQGMVFAINSVETSPRNFSAFQSVAETLNGTAPAGGISQSPSGAMGNSLSMLYAVLFAGMSLISLL